MNWTKLEPVRSEDINRGCICCSHIEQVAHLDTEIAVGFGMANCTRDGEQVYDGEADYMQGNEPKTVNDMEKLAAEDPDHDWRITLFAPLHGEVYQRHDIERWVLVESNTGFA